jgi:hypothetical protein
MQTVYTMALFGEAEKGEYRTPCFCASIQQLLESFGNPPPDSKGIFYAIQALLFHRSLIFFRVREEGFSYSDYIHGVQLLQKKELITGLAAICLPGVGDADIIESIHPLCLHYHSLLITNEADLYDYLTEISA